MLNNGRCYYFAKGSSKRFDNIRSLCLFLLEALAQNPTFGKHYTSACNALKTEEKEREANGASSWTDNRHSRAGQVETLKNYFRTYD